MAPMIVDNGQGSKKDFDTLAVVHTEVVAQLQQEEAPTNTLASQLFDSSGGASHGYFCEPFTVRQLGLPVEVCSSKPLPPMFVDAQQRMQVATFMGLIPELHHAWLSVDNVLLLWDYANDTNDVKSFTQLDQVIIAVGLAVPRHGVFKSVVKHLLVVATPVELVLIAVTDVGNGRLELRPTQFSASSDGINMNIIRGHPCGRIFMAGKDGNVHELVYDAGGLGSWFSYIGATSGSRKCRKVNASSNPSTALWNSFMQIIPGIGFGPASFADLAIDSLRNVMYTVDITGVLSQYDLGVSGEDMKKVGCSLNLWIAAADFCRQHSANRAQDVPDARAFSSGHGQEIVGLGIVDPCDDSSVHVIAIASSGLRIYLGPVTRNGMHDNARGSVHVQVLHVRSPPPISFWGYRSKCDAAPGLITNGTSSDSLQPSTGFEAGIGGIGTTGVTGRGIKIASAVYYSHRVMFLAQKGTDEGHGDSFGGDIVAICDDLTERMDSRKASLAETALEVQSSKGGLLARHVYDIQEHPTLLLDSDISSFASLVYTSPTPKLQDEIIRQLNEANLDSPISLQDAKTVQPAKINAGPSFPGEVPPPPPLCLPTWGWDGGLRGAVGIVPLGELSVQHLMPQRRILCLSCDGLHMISKLRPIDVLYRALSNANRPQNVQLFFDSYGKIESCSMCFAMACGLPADLGIQSEALPEVTRPGVEVRVPSSTARRLAVEAIQKFGGVPRFAENFDHFRQADGALGTNMMPPMSGMGNVIFNEEFRHSAQYSGLVRFLSRLLRPAWFRVMAIHAAKRHIATSGCDIDFIISDQDLIKMGAPLKKLLELMRTLYQTAVQEDWMAKYATVGYQQDQNTLRAAQRRECEALHRVYRLASRASQALSLIGILRDVLHKHPQCRAPWSVLQNIRLSQMVVGRGSHAAIERLLLTLVGGDSGLSREDSGRLAGSLRGECYLFFSQGDALAHEGAIALMSAEELQRVEYGSPKAKAESDRAVKLLSQAATYWRGPLVTAQGGILHAACRDLGRLRRFDGIVHICLACAANFSSRASAETMRVNGEGGNQRWLPPPGVPEWELNIYHGGTVTDQSEKDRIIQECHCMILRYLEALLNPVAGTNILQGETPEEADRRRHQDANMLLANALASTDDAFHFRLYECLIENDPRSLLRLESDKLEDWLRNRDPNLLHQHLRKREKFAKAAELEYQLSIQENVSLTQRIEHLVHCIADFREISGDRMDISNVNVQDQSTGIPSLLHLESVLEIARIQLNIKVQAESSIEQLKAFLHDTVESDSNRQAAAEIKRRSELAKRLEYELHEVTPLYNDFARPLAVWDSCLLIIAICGEDKPSEINALWRGIIWREVPLKATTISIHLWLNDMRRSGEIPQDAVARIMKASSEVRFEHSDWLAKLQSKISGVGQQITDKKSRFAFPINFLVDELEEISLKHREALLARNMVLSPEEAVAEKWPLDSLLNATPTRFVDLYMGYSASIRKSDRATHSKQLQLIVQTSRLVQRWITASSMTPFDLQAMGSQHEAEAAVTLVTADKGGALSRQLAELRSKLQTLHGVTSRESRTVIDQTAQTLQKAEDYLSRRSQNGAASRRREASASSVMWT